MVFTMAAIGLTACYIKERLNLDSLYAKLLLILGGVFIHNLILLFMSGVDEMILLIFINVIPGAVYTTVIAWIFFLIKDGKISYQKVKSIF